MNELIPYKTLCKYFHIKLSYICKAESIGINIHNLQMKKRSLETESDSLMMTQLRSRLGHWISVPSLPFLTVPLHLFILSQSWGNLFKCPQCDSLLWSQKLRMLTVIPTWHPAERHLAWTVTWRLHPLRIMVPVVPSTLYFKTWAGEKTYIDQ